MMANFNMRESHAHIGGHFEILTRNHECATRCISKKSLVLSFTKKNSLSLIDFIFDNDECDCLCDFLCRLYIGMYDVRDTMAYAFCSNDRV